ncbi:MAG: hypothetical protein KJP15_12025 [Gammaproteobacteria bacterium]|nr:hypothetical protein [Gammaproteobacteria bacterium]
MSSSILKFHHIIALAVFLPFLSSCTNTKITSVWMDSEKAGTAFNDILIIGIADEEHNRRLFEEQFTNQLKAAGIESEVSYTLLPQGTDINRDTVSTAIEGKSIDAVIVTHLIAVEEETVYRPGMDYQPAYGYYDGLYSYYPHVNTYVHQPGYYTTHEVVRLETNLYEVATEELVWSAQSSSFAPESAKEVIDELVKLVIKDLQQKGLIKTKQS